MKTAIRFLALILFTGLFLLPSSYAQVDPCSQPLNISGWRQEGGVQQNWIFDADGQGGRQTFNGIPMFLMSGVDYINVKISGTLEVDDYTYAAWIDNDFIGFVLGATGPDDANGTNHQYYLVDWNGRDDNGNPGGGDVANSGVNMFDVNTTLNDPLTGGGQVSSMFWNHNNWPSQFQLMQRGSGNTWAHQVTYDFQVFYTSTNVKVVINHGVFNNDTVLDVDGCFRPGEFGFYNYSQPSAIYGNLTIQNIADFGVSNDSICAGDIVTMSAAGCQGLGYYNDHPSITLNWEVDDSINYTGASIDHTFLVPGNHKVQLVVGNQNACNDTAVKYVYVDGGPTIAVDDFDLCPGLDSLVSLPGFTSYDWFMDASGSASTYNVSGSGTYAVEISSLLGCTYIDTFTVGLADVPSLDVGEDFNLCFGEDSLITIQTDGIQVEWNDGATGNNFTASAGNVYVAEAFNAEGCFVLDTLIVPMICCDNNSFQSDTIAYCQGDTGTNKLFGNFDDVVWLDSNIVTVSDSGVVTTSMNQSQYIRVLDRKIGDNAIINGDFENGNAAFTTQYTQSCFVEPWMQQGGYCVSTNPNQQNGGFANMGDHTTGNGNMMIVDGSPVANQQVWCQTISVTPNTNYEFSTWLATAYAPNPAQLQFSIDGNLLGNVFTAPTNQGVWNQYTASWNSGTTESAQMCIVNQNTNGSGNDFAIDDISFSPVCEEKDSFYVDVKTPVDVQLRSDTAICEGDSVQLIGITNAQNNWSTGDTTLSTWISNDGVYKVEVINEFGCIAEDSMELTLYQNPMPNLGLDTAICSEDDFIKNIGIGNAWTWSTGEVTQSITINDSGRYAVEVTDQNGCVGVDTFYVEKYNLPQPYLGPDTLICAYDSLKLEANAIGVYNWSNGTNQSETWVNSDGEYWIEVTDSNGCVNTDTMNLTVPNLVEVNLREDTALCNEESIQVVADAGVIWNWNTGSNDSVIAVHEEGNYSVVVTDQYGCKDTDEFYLTVFPLPTPDLGPDFGICLDEAETIAVSDEFVNFYWNDSIVAGNSWDVSGGVSRQIKVEVTDTNGCIDSDSLWLTVYPSIELQLTGIDSFCTNDNVLASPQIQGGSPPFDFEWSNGTTTRNQRFTEPGEYVLNVIDMYGCNDVDSINIVQLPLPLVDLGSDQYLCKGDTIVISDLEGQNMGDLYSWSEASFSGSIDTISNVRIGRNVSVMKTDQYGCVNTDTVYVGVYDLPNPELPNGPYVCEGDTIEIGLSNTFSTYEWSTGVLADNSISYVHGSDRLIWVEVTDENNCKNRDSTMVNELEDIEISMPSNDSVCPGKTVQLIPNITGGMGLFNYIWSDGTTNMSNTVSDENEYYLFTSDDYGCEDTAFFNLIHHEVPVADIGEEYEVCLNDEILIENIGDTSTSNQFRWSQRGSMNHEFNYSGYSVGQEVLWLEIVSEYGCKSVDSTMIVTKALPYPELGEDQVVCFADSAVLSVTTETADNDYTWNVPGSNSEVIVREDGNYAVEVNHQGCIQTDSVRFEFVTIPEIKISEWMQDTIYCFDSLRAPIQLSAYEVESEERYTYRWDNGAYSFNNEVSYPGTYEVEVSLKGCSKTGNITIVDYCQPYLITPNAFTPNGDGLNDVFLPVSAYVNEFEMYIYNRWGQEVYASSNAQEGWNGKFQNTGQLSQVDVYVYKIIYSVTNLDGFTEQVEEVGHLTLLK